jgi:radical SAM superfamily enzyme YgiQ (UPF0313 family)
MKIDLIHPAHYRDDGTLVQAKAWWQRLDGYLPHLGPPLIAALTPAEHEVRVIEEYHRDVDLETDADVIGISAQIMQFDRAVDLSRAFRARGKRTVLGGFLPSMLPDRVEGLFDAIVVGEGDELWPQVLEDAKRGALRARYTPARPVDLTKLPVPRYDLIDARGRVVVYPVQATRGCPFTCTYCSIAAVFQGSYRKRPIEHIVRDVVATGSRNINFCDDNLCEDVKWVVKLFEALEGLKLRWGTQTTINVARHPNVLAAARRAGCVLMALGVETLSAGNLEEVDKTFHAVDKYADGFRRIMDAGITPQALIIFGLPEDNSETFKRTVDYLERLKVPIAQFFILTPYPGTPQGDKIWRDSQVFDDRLAHLREPYVVYQPKQLSPRALQDGWWSALEDFYSLSSIAKRVVLRKKPNNLLINLAQNLVYWSKVRRGVHPVYFGN